MLRKLQFSGVSLTKGAKSPAGSQISVITKGETIGDKEVMEDESLIHHRTFTEHHLRGGESSLVVQMDGTCRKGFPKKRVNACIAWASNDPQGGTAHISLGRQPSPRI